MNIGKYNPDKECNGLVFANNLNEIVNEVFIKRRKLNISAAFITQSYFAVPKSVTLNLTYLFIIKIPNKWELEQIALNDSSNIDFMNFMNFYKKSTTKSYTFLVINTTLASDNPLSFRNNCQEKI